MWRRRRRTRRRGTQRRAGGAGGQGDLLRASGRFESVQRRKNRNLYTTAATFAGTASKARATGVGGGEKEPRGRKPQTPLRSLSDVADPGRWIRRSEGGERRRGRSLVGQTGCGSYPDRDVGNGMDRRVVVRTVGYILTHQVTAVFLPPPHTNYPTCFISYLGCNSTAHL